MKGEEYMRGGEEWLEEVRRGWRSKTCNLLQMVLYLVICSSMVGVVVSGVLTYSYLDAYKFSTASCSTTTLAKCNRSKYLVCNHLFGPFYRSDDMVTKKHLITIFQRFKQPGVG